MASLTVLKFSTPEGASQMLDKVTAELKGYEFELIASNLTKEQEEQLKAAFAEE
jgi:uncharacterized membrane protein